MKKGFWKNKEVIVTGANGFIGSWLCKALVEREARVTALVRNKKKQDLLKNSGIEKKVKIKEADITDFNSLRNIFEKIKPEYCFHLAAQTVVDKSQNSVHRCFKTNVGGTWNVVKATKQRKLKGILIASTTKVYGDQGRRKANELSALKAKDPYSISKICSEKIALATARCFGINVAILRTSNVFGGNDFNLVRLVPNAISKVLKNQQPVIHGRGLSKLDFIFVGDVVNAYLSAGEKIEKSNGQIINVATGKSIAVRKVVEKITGLSKRKVKPKFVKKREEKRVIIIDNSKARKLISWKPKYSLEKGLLKTIKWYKNYYKK